MTHVTELDIVKYTQEGRGLAYHEERPAFILGALPGEKVKVALQRRRRGVQEGTALSVLANPHIDRVVPPCEHFGVCGGCSLQHLSVKAQTQMKQELLQNLVRQQLNQEPEHWYPPCVGDPWAYRHRARMSLKWLAPKQQLCIGFHETFSHKTVEVKHCAVLHPQLMEAVLHFKNWLITQPRLRDQIPQIELSQPGVGAPAVVIRTFVDWTPEEAASLVNVGWEYQIRFYLQRKGPETVKLIDDRWPFHLTYTVLGQTLSYGPLDFTQTHLRLNESMVQQAIDTLQIQPSEYVIDLFCGIGNFTVPLAKKTHRILGIEGSEAMTRALLQNAQNNQSEHIQGRALNLLTTPIDPMLSLERPDKVLLDPPRSGAEPLLPWLIECAPKRIVYVSCQPMTLIRDLRILLSSGQFILEGVGMLDMFPQTAHTEAMAVLRRIEPW